MGDFVDEMLDSRVPTNRKATNDLESPPAQRLRRVVPESPNNSIQGILRANSGERLYVRPICWTSRQLQLLNCYFVREEVHLKIGDPPVKSVLKTLRNQEPKRKPISAIARLLAPATSEAKQSDVREILSCYDIHPLLLNDGRVILSYDVRPIPSKRLAFNFGRRSSDSLQKNHKRQQTISKNVKGQHRQSMIQALGPSRSPFLLHPAQWLMYSTSMSPPFRPNFSIVWMPHRNLCPVILFW
ncbi:hypothetical protein P170DRAFT_481184 [Aspergillus steynii IBT 23096]|uniref:Uncharacterized protein n=1 Tax=Aspergillus steynii IBT 23096 TaxID=1392250 RepID=A0A2I2FRJ8_9EURO|nr:uncharacterized protein P170DRAFT_481184 [Aspergillus steynii IBT 23096]PLB43237.1 hypothetical protein P170DRAFT_481184 [Aspergillus steynii IBT 23096]